MASVAYWQHVYIAHVSNGLPFYVNPSMTHAQFDQKETADLAVDIVVGWRKLIPFFFLETRNQRTVDEFASFDQVTRAFAI